MKKLLVFLVAICVFASWLPCMAESEFADHITFSAANWTTTSANVDYTSDPFYAMLSEKFNVTIEPWITDASAHNEKCSIWVNTFSMPDVLVYTDFNYATYSEWADQGMIAPLPDGWEERYPNLAKVIEKSMIKDYLTIDGKIYAIPASVFVNFNEMDIPVRHNCVFYRKDWVEQLNLEPFGDVITLDQLKEYAKLAVENDLAGNGNTIGISASDDHLIAMFMAMTGLDYSAFVKTDDGYIWGPTADGVTDRIALLREWYAEGLFHPDCYSIEQWNASGEFVTGESAALIGDGGTSNQIDSYLYFDMSNPELDSHACIGSAVLADSDGTVYTTETTNFWTVKYFNPDIAPEVMERILAIIDWACDPTDGQISAYKGIKGVDWDFNEEGQIKYLIENPEERNDYLGDDLITVWGTCADELYFIDSGTEYPEAIENAVRNYAIKNAGVVIPYDYDYAYYRSDAKSVYSVDVNAKITELMVDGSLDIESEWAKMISDNEGMWKPLLDELNAVYFGK